MEPIPGSEEHHNNPYMNTSDIFDRTDNFSFDAFCAVTRSHEMRVLLLTLCPSFLGRLWMCMRADLGERVLGTEFE